MVLSAISSKGVGQLYIVEEIMRQDQYIKVSQAQLVPQLQKWFQNNDEFVFMQGCRTSKSVKKYFESAKIPLLPWSGDSPYLNPIENRWVIVKRKMAKVQIANRTQLIERLIEIWHYDLDVKNAARNCIRSIPKCIAEVIKKCGQRTK